MTDRFSEVLSVVLGFEGGYADDSDDRGGRTNYGITEGTLRSAYERKIVSHKDIRSLSKADAALIYWSDYWEPIGA
ncbi:MULTISPECIES: glycosyl hydrolase 108 family protein, partial [Dethiosulfovibrio]